MKSRSEHSTRDEANSRDEWKWLAVILAGYLGLALAYNLVTPFTKNPDEGPHADYIRYLVERLRFPVLGSEPGLTYEAHQPPLYYLIAAPVCAGVHTVAPGAAPARRDAAERAVRLLTTLIGGLGLLLIWALARVLYRSDRWLRLAATAFAAFLPMRLAMAAAVSNDMLLEVLFTASLLLMALMIRQGSTPRRAAALGLAMGAALLTKATGILLLPTALIALMLASRVQGDRATGRRGDGETGRGNALVGSLRRPVPPSPRSPRRPVASPASPREQFDARSFFSGCAIAFGITFLLAGPWLFRNRALYGDFLGQHAFETYFTTTHAAPLREDFLTRFTVSQYWLRFVVPYTYASFWGVFGHMDVWMPRAVYLALLVPTVLGAVGAVIHLMRGREVLDETQRGTWLVLCLCLFLVVSGFLRFNTLFFQAQGRYLSPAMGPIVLLLVAGWFVFVPGRARPAFTAGLALGMAALALYALLGVIAPFFA